MTYKFGYVSVVGRPNAGKSTLVNQLVGAKVAIVSPKRQTTRNNIMGILTEKNYQIVFTDTPGIHKTRHSLDKFMMKNVRSALSGADLILYLIDSSKPLNVDEAEYISSLKENEVPVLTVKTKIDLKESRGYYFKADLEISSFTGNGLDELIKRILPFLRESKIKNFEFAEDLFTDKSMKFMAAETIREFALRFLHEEIPHGVAVEIVKFEDTENLIKIEADIICERKTHKGIIIGKGGESLKKIGAAARGEMERLFDKKIFLKTFVKVEEGWRNNSSKLTEIGFN